MHFKSLELLGFKSFAEKTKLNFEPGVTAVVGPNGCGKSNVADSIRWVLGEQSAKSLRASSMQDVIFNGTDNKEPINFAEVSLTFSNEKRSLPIDYDEVTITRRVFRSGESEYLLNKTPVRLKDIADLLMGTGIGTESYSIIEQGKMDLILSSKPEDRRYVFEEASGITKYKARKKEAMRKLEQTEQNLLRINDIITEVKRQIGSIERQARKAERYKADFDKLKDMEVKLSARDYKNLKMQEATFSVENDDTKVREKDLSAEMGAMSARISEERQALGEINNKISTLRNRFSELTNTLDMNKHKIEIDKERIGEACVLQEGLRKEIESAGEKIRAAKALVEKLRLDLERVVSERVSKQNTVEASDLKLKTITAEIGQIEEKAKTFKLQIVDFLSRETHIKNDLIKMGADLQNRRMRQRRLEIEKGEVTKELESTEGALSGILAEFRAIEEKVLALKSDLEARKHSKEAVMAEISAAESDISKEENRRSATISKIEMLEESLKTHEGFKSGVRSLLVKAGEDPALLPGVLGVLADMIKVEKGYEEAVSTFLGEDAQLVITENDSDIVRSIEYLKDNRLGRASFVSLETLRRLGAPAAASGGTPLGGFVRIDERFGRVVGHLFANTYIAGSVEEGMKASASTRARFVTKSGHLFDNCKVSGGSESEESPLIGRRQRLEDFRNELRSCEDKIASLIAARDTRKSAHSALEAEITSIDAVLRQEDINYANAKAKKDAQEENVKKLSDEIFLLGSELDEVNQVINELSQKGDALNVELNKIEAEKTSMQDFIDRSQILVLDKKSEREKTALDMATLRAEAQSLEKEEAGVRGSLKSQEAMVFEFEDTLYAKETLLKESDEKVKSLEAEINDLTARNEMISGDLKVAGEEAAAVEGSRADLGARLNMDEVQLKEKEAQVEAFRNLIRDLDVKLTELNFKKTNLRDRLLQAYKFDIEIMPVEFDESLDWDNILVQVTELKEKLEKMGPVNLVAIDEHKELEERHNFLVRQQEDLVGAKDSLMKAIQKINKTTKDLFLETFQKIQVEFKNFFRMLFGGGQAELVLIDEQDILESGIEIIVRPPGKKLQNLMLLSGGEKAMTACALLFAVFKVKPSPFCVLDELDAPLDESNVVRFASVLKEFIKMSQFIIITHNKRTMELADVIYGVTMQERGISKIVSVKFLDERKNVAAKAVEQQAEKPPEIAEPAVIAIPPTGLLAGQVPPRV
ncbi:MAG: chromosome segregation protein SMC [Candidatus Omnitrophica bacterium]|nr:chromosome segregation protein SMC [Candidatus Omnitrophota bacterium]